MSVFALSPRAKTDIDDIWEFTVARWGLDQAETYIRQLHAAMATIARQPKLGRDCARIRAGYRRHPSGSHVLFYRETATGVEIVRILHQGMDHERHL